MRSLCVFSLPTMESLQSFYSILSAPKEPIRVLKDIVPFWKSNKDVWFSHMPIDYWPMEDSVYIDNKMCNMQLLLHYDQIYRHPNPYIKEADKPYAFLFATQIALRMLHNGQYDAAEDWEKVFILLALRHNKTLGLKGLALTKILTLATDTPSPLYLRFLQATIWDVHCFKHAIGYSPEPIRSFDDRIGKSELLERGESLFPKSLEPIRENPTTYKTYNSILEAPKPLPPHFNVAATERVLMDAFTNTIQTKTPGSKIAISISGGVDSMVAAYIADKVCRKYNIDIILLHICYNNRDCCEDECNLLRDYSQRLGRPLFIRMITEMKRCRSSQLRAVYEEITRKIRFSFYDAFQCPVILGHNRDDCFENVFRNLSTRTHYENLFGMSVSSYEQGVQILRPMLEIPKKDIVAYADANNIPHLYDSTPAWSQRGLMRDQLIPGIQSFDPNILSGLEEFVRHAAFLDQQWQLMFQTWMSSLETSEHSCTIPRDAFFTSNSQRLNFWIQMWKYLGWSDRPSNKSFQNLMQTLHRTQGKCNLNNKYYVALFPDVLVLFHSL